MKKKLLSLLAAVTVAAGFTAFAVPAKPGLRTYTQPDGTQLTVRLVGDERCHYYLTDDDYPLLPDAQGRLCYAVEDAQGQPVASNVVAGATPRRGAAARSILQANDPAVLIEKIRIGRQAASRMKVPQTGMGLSSTNFPHVGDIKSIVVLVEYKDVKFKTASPNQYFTDLLNKQGFSQQGGTGSCRDFYMDASHNLFRPQFDVYGPITLSQNMSYYGGNDMWGKDKNPEKMAIEACQQLNATVDFSQYDLDNDGYIDNVYVFYAGQGEASGGSSDTVWPHSWEIAAAGGGTYTFDGKVLNHYACSNEWEGGRPDGIGTFCHEFGHVMGLPDLYATDYNHSKTPGEWCLMDQGSYNNGSRTPPTLGAFERNALGWMELEQLTDACSVDLPNILDSNKAYIIPNPNKSSEFFLFENRQLTGWDSYLPGHGMLIWHIDFVQSKWDSNVVNNTSTHQYVDIEEANNSVTNRAGNPFPGTANKTSFTGTTNPAFKTWSGTVIDMPITNIAEKNGLITFDVKGGLIELADVTSVAAVDSLSTPYSLTINWPKVDKATGYVLDVWTDNGGVSYVEGYQGKILGSDNSHTIEGLQPETLYHFAIRAKAGNVLSPNATAGSASTPAVTFEFMAPTVREATDISDKTFTANWDAMDDAVDYSLTVYAQVPTGSTDVTADMGQGTQLSLPEGWSSNSKTIYTSTLYAGQAIPSLKLGKEGDYLMTPRMDGAIKTVSFWYRGASTSATNSLEIQYRADESAEWTGGEKITGISTSQGTTYNGTIPAGMHQLRIVYNKPGNGNVALDDVVIGLEAVQRDVVAAYNSLSVGNVTSYTVDLSDVNFAGTEVEYLVAATNAEGKRSFDSQLQKVYLDSNSSSVADINAQPALKVVDGSVLYTGKPGTVIAVSDAQGRIVARTQAARNGQATVQLPSNGVYIISAGQLVHKVAVK